MRQSGKDLDIKNAVILPKGPYMSKVRNVHYHDGLLKAQVRDKRDKWQYVSIPASLEDYICIQNGMFVKKRFQAKEISEDFSL